MREIKVFTRNQKGEKLVGVKTYPDKTKNKYPAVLLVHGFGVTRDEYNGYFPEFAKSLSSAGYLIYRFDFSGCGESEGDFSKITLTKRVEDLRSLLNFLKIESEIDVNNIAIVAQSFGTSPTIILAPNIKAIALLGSFHNLTDVFAHHFGTAFNPNGLTKIPRSDGGITAIDSQFWPDLKRYNLLEDIKKTNTNLLFVHGDKDATCPLEEMESLFEAANEPKEKIVIKGNDHCQDPDRNKAYKVVISWLDKNLR